MGLNFTSRVLGFSALFLTSFLLNFVLIAQQARESELRAQQIKILSQVVKLLEKIEGTPTVEIDTVVPAVHMISSGDGLIIAVLWIAIIFISFTVGTVDENGNSWMSGGE